MTASTYAALAPSSIRLLQFNADSGLRCSLAAYELSTAPAYNALSYAWREIDDEELPSDQEWFININGESVKVQRNLYHALTTLGCYMRTRDLRLWVDYICINQRDIAERNCQVQMMKSIYERAQQVTAWLGLPYNESRVQRAIGLMVAWKDMFDQMDDISDAFLLEKKPGAPIDEDMKEAWCGLALLFYRNLWRRTWIYQEATLPTTRFYCGHHSFDQITLRLSCAIVSVYTAQFILPPEFQFNNASLSTTLNLTEACKSRRQHIARPETSTLLTLVRELRLTDCSDFRDKVFAAIPHACDAASSQVLVDYGRDLVAVYIDVVRCALSHGNLEVLGYILTPLPSFKTRQPQLPSWVPDWRQRTALAPLGSQPRTTSAYEPIYEPCPGLELDAHIVGPELHIRGLLVDAITMVTPPHIFRDEAEAAAYGMPAQDWRNSSNPDNLGPAKMLLKARGATFSEEAFSRTSVCDSKMYVDDEHGVRVVRRDFSSEQFETQATDRTTRELVWERRVWTIRQKLLAHRTLGYTRRDKLAVVPAATVEGDMIAAFFGGGSLYAIRPDSQRDNAYRFIGECYVDEEMDGELMKMMRDEGLESELICIV